MKIEDMRIGGRYMLAGREVECVCLAVELHGSVKNQAAYRDERDAFVWRPCEEFQPLAPPVKTIKARCAVAVSPDGAYSVNGWSFEGKDGHRPDEDRQMRSTVIDTLDRDECAVHFAEIEVPVPARLELKGQVE